MDEQPLDRHTRREAAFQRMGAERVRAAVIRGTWSAEKRDAARAWIEREDAAAWQARRPEDTGNGSAVLAFRSKRWWWLVTPGIAALGLARMIVHLRH